MVFMYSYRPGGLLGRINTLYSYMHQPMPGIIANVRRKHVQYNNYYKVSASRLLLNSRSVHAHFGTLGTPPGVLDTLFGKKLILLQPRHYNLSDKNSTSEHQLIIVMKCHSSYVKLLKEKTLIPLTARNTSTSHGHICHPSLASFTINGLS